MQASLFAVDGKKKTIVNIPTEKLVTSWLNPRRTRPQSYIDRLAERMQRNGFEITRALWAYAENGHYEVFAGGTRLEAAKVANIETVPVVLHEGYTDDELTRLADEDNENDEYHAPVSVVDVWMDYKKLIDTPGWTQQRIANAKGVNQALVALRLNYTSFPDAVMTAFIKNDFLKEGHAAEIRKLLNFNNFAPWLTRDSLMIEVFKQVVDKHGKTVTAKHFKQAVDAINEVIKLAESIADTLGKQTLYSDDGTAYEWDARSAFIERLAETNARTQQTVKSAEHHTRKVIADNLRAHQERLAQAAKLAEEEERKSKPVEVSLGQWWKLGSHLLYCGDTSQPQFYNQIANAAFAFADPPYNAGVDDWDKDFVWQHDWLESKSPVVAVTPGISAIKDFMRISEMVYRWSVACWIDNGMTRGAMGFGNWIYVAMHGKDSIYANTQDILRISIDNTEREENNFKGRKPSALLEKLIGDYTKQGDTVIDPFLGYGTTLYTAERMGRRCIGGEIDEQRCKEIIERFEAFTGTKGELVDG